MPKHACALLAGRDADAEAGLQQPALGGLAGQVAGDARLLCLAARRPHPDIRLDAVQQRLQAHRWSPLVLALLRRRP